MKESGRRVPGEGGGVGDPIQADGAGESPLRADEYETYGTDQSAGDASTAADTSVASSPRTWFAIGVGLLIAFLAILVWAVLQPLL